MKKSYAITASLITLTTGAVAAIDDPLTRALIALVTMVVLWAIGLLHIPPPWMRRFSERPPPLTPRTDIRIPKE